MVQTNVAVRKVQTVVPREVSRLSSVSSVLRRQVPTIGRHHFDSSIACSRFYVFVCSICNHGKEFLRRLEMKWVDLVHLMLFNLTAYNSKKYYDLDTTIIPYINDNWHALQLPPKVS
jgi:hypothetical protein